MSPRKKQVMEVTDEQRQREQEMLSRAEHEMLERQRTEAEAASQEAPAPVEALASEREEMAVEAEQEVALGTEVVVSAPPRPIKPVSDDVGEAFRRYDEQMRERAAGVYRRMQADDGRVPMEPDLPAVITWMRSKGVRIRTQMTMEGSFYVLEPKPD